MKNCYIVCFILFIGINSGYAQSVIVGQQVWSIKNLDVSNFRNGDLIPEAKTDAEWKNAGKNKGPAWCYYDNNPGNGVKYGKLYNYYAVHDNRGLAPKGWHVMTSDEWREVINFIGDYEDLSPLRSTSGWENNGNGSDVFSINILPAGSRSSVGIFGGEFLFAYFWVRDRYVILGYDSHDRYWDEMGDDNSFGFSVRCVED
jgi:uncharacterized protein (TIGR02145 family)